MSINTEIVHLLPPGMYQPHVIYWLSENINLSSPLNAHDKIVSYLNISTLILTWNRGVVKEEYSDNNSGIIFSILQKKVWGTIYKYPHVFMEK